jgi:hypothetical protein
MPQHVKNNVCGYVSDMGRKPISVWVAMCISVVCLNSHNKLMLSTDGHECITVTGLMPNAF